MPVDKIRMSQLHEQFLAELTGGRKTKGSGSQWTDQMDARAHRFDVRFAVASDGKATLGQSITVSLPMVLKAIQQAAGERPLLGLRWYANERLDVAQDWIAVRADDFGELLEMVNNPYAFLSATLTEREWTDGEIEEFKQRMREWTPEFIHTEMQIVPVTDEVEQLNQQLRSAHELIAEQESQIRTLGERPTQDQHRLLMGQYSNAESERRNLETLVEAMKSQIASAEAESPLALANQIGQLQQQVVYQAQIIAGQRQRIQASEGQRSDLEQLMSAPPPKLPWTVVFRENRGDGKPHARGLRYDEAGQMAEFPVTGELRVEELASGGQQLIVNGQRVKEGDLYVNGRLQARIGA